MRVTGSDYLYLFFFFFQAEDGIRDWSVTGVQTCALPISDHPASVASGAPARNRPDRGEVRRAPRWRSRDTQRGPDRTSRRTRRRASFVFPPFGPFHLKPADPDGVALLGTERAQLAFDAGPDQLPLEVGGRVGRPPVDAAARRSMRSPSTRKASPSRLTVQSRPPPANAMPRPPGAGIP